jgi:hypothetical protein
MYLANTSAPRCNTPLGLGFTTTEPPHRTSEPILSSGDGTSNLGNSEAYNPLVLYAFQKMTQHPNRQLITRDNSATGRVNFEIACLTALPPQTSEELALISAPLTPMEQDELGGSFGSAPLSVRNGIAVTEEGVELHVADFITQF